MKLAPNVKLLSKDKGEDAVIFAGDDAYMMRRAINALYLVR